ncbi:MAG: TniB family NTP-binding protein [Cognatishimia sp.]
MSKFDLPIISQLVRHDFFERAYREVEQHLAAKDPRTGAIIPLLGPTRIGKTAVASLLKKKIGKETETSASLLPVSDFVFGKLPPKPNDRDIYRAALEAFGLNCRERENTAAVRKRLIHTIQQTKVRVIALDECNHCAERGANLSARAAADHLKTIVDETGVTLLLLGLPRFQSIIDGNEQLRDRSTNTVYLQPYDWQKEEDRDAFCGVVFAVLDAIKKDGFSVDFEFEDLAPRLYGASAGRVPVALRMIKSTLMGAGERRHLDTAAFAETARRMQQQPISPFAFFQGDCPDDVMLIRSYATVMAEAGLHFNAESPNGLQVSWDTRLVS